jgi:hypothetical protein
MGMERESCSTTFIVLMPLMALGRERGKVEGGVGFDYGEREGMQRC